MGAVFGRNVGAGPRGGAPIGAGGHDPHFSRQRGTGDKSLKTQR